LRRRKARRESEARLLSEQQALFSRAVVMSATLFIRCCARLMIVFAASIFRRSLLSTFSPYYFFSRGRHFFSEFLPYAAESDAISSFPPDGFRPLLQSDDFRCPAYHAISFRSRFLIFLQFIFCEQL